MTESDEKLADKTDEQIAAEFAIQTDMNYLPPIQQMYLVGRKQGFLAGVAHERARSQKLVEVLKIIAMPLSDSINSSEVEIEQTLAAQRALKEYEGEAK